VLVLSTTADLQSSSSAEWWMKIIGKRHDHENSIIEMISLFAGKLGHESESRVRVSSLPEMSSGTPSHFKLKIFKMLKLSLPVNMMIGLTTGNRDPRTEVPVVRVSPSWRLGTSEAASPVTVTVALQADHETLTFYISIQVVHRCHKVGPGPGLQEVQPPCSSRSQLEGAMHPRSASK
jgi:hypothetical protein